MNNIQILIVDDIPDNTFLLSGLLLENGYETLIADSAESCFSILSQNEPDIILMDIMMPEITGIEALEKIQSDSKLKHIPVIMVTAKTDSKDVEEALSKGAIDYIKKPIDEIELLARIKTTLRLKESEDKLKDLLKSYESFIRMVSHDLRSPFTAILGFAELLHEDKNLNEAQRESLQFIIDSTNHSVDYFNKLLDWTKIGASEIILTKKIVSLNKMLEYTKVLYQKKADEKGIDLSLTFNEEIQLNIDDVYLSQSINNLVNNAIKFTPLNGTVKISALKENNSIKITILDNGIGMPNITNDELFSKTINDSRKGTQGEKGTGIGLAISKKIIDAHGFTLTFISEKDKFTEFTITINQPNV